MMAIVNDLLGWSKDRDARWPNLLMCVAADIASMEQAFVHLATLQDLRVAEMAQCVDALLADASVPLSVIEWARAMRHLVSGFGSWHVRSPRYRSVHELEGGKRVRIDDMAPAQRRKETSWPSAV